MANWYKKLQDKNNQEWRFSVIADVNVSTDNKNEDTAYKILKTRLNKIEGDASVDTGIESNISFLIQGLYK